MSYEWKETLNDFKKHNGGDTILMMVESYASIDLNMKYYGSGTKEGGQVPVSKNLSKVLFRSANIDINFIMTRYLILDTLTNLFTF